MKTLKTDYKNCNLPLLSPESIQLLINYYNEYKVLPENVDVEIYMETEYKFGIDSSWEEIKLNQQGEVDITIPEIKEKSYTKKDLIQAFEAGNRFPTFLQWFNTRKK